MAHIRSLVVIAALLVAAAAPAASQGAPAPAPAPAPVIPGPAGPGDVLVFRQGWAPVFCFAGSAGGGIPDEYCGFEPVNRTRYQATRAFRIFFANSTGDTFQNCPDPTSGLDYSNLKPYVERSLQCVDNSYSVGNQADWLNYVWNLVGTCTAHAVGPKMTPARYYQLTTDSFRRYSMDAALKKAGIDVTTARTLDANSTMDIYEKIHGFRPFLTCDSGTKSKFSTFSICLSAQAPHRITKCPDKFLKPLTGCASPLALPHENSIPIPVECARYYPSTYTWPDSNFKII
jgi:hypothetical protein